VRSRLVRLLASALICAAAATSRAESADGSDDLVERAPVEYDDPALHRAHFEDTLLGRALLPWDRMKRRLWDRTGIDFLLAYSPLVQIGSQDSQISTAYHELDLRASWPLLESQRWGKGRLQLWFLHLLTIGGTDAGEFQQAAGSIWLSNDGETDSSGSLSALQYLWWEHWLFRDQLRLVLGQLDPIELLDQNRFYGDATGSFISGLLSANAVVRMLNRQGLGAFVQVVRERWYLSGLAMDADAKRRGGDVPSFLDAERQYAGELGITPRLGLGEGNYRLSLYYTEVTGSRDTEQSGVAYSISLDQDLGERYGLFFRYSQAHNNRMSVKRGLATGVVLREPLGFANDELGFAFLWGRPQLERTSSGSTRDQLGIETYWRFQLTDHIELTPDIQLLIPPGLGSDDFRFIGGLRLRLVL
jgi:porin